MGVYAGSDGMAPGRPGQRWVNPTSDTWYQWVSSLRRPCATCLRRHGRLSPRRQGAQHPHCQCHELAVPPGAEAPIEARTPAQTWAVIPAAGRSGLVGEDTLRLLRAGLVAVEDVAGTEAAPWPLPAFAELVGRKGLTVGQLRAAGVDEAAARRATAMGAAAGGR